MKSLAFMHRNDTRFAVGDFSPVLSVFSHHELGNTTSPFLLLDHIGPGYLQASSQRKGVHEHPHRGFETVTMVFAGELEHRDSTGGGGVIGAGDVQWMTAAAGILHEEFFSDAFSRLGGRFELVQLWVNLPAARKMSSPGYQSLTRKDIPTVVLPRDAGAVRVIAGHFHEVTGPASTHTRISILDVHLRAGHEVVFKTAAGDTALVFLRTGSLQFAADERLESDGMAVMSSNEADFALTALEHSEFLVLIGEPIHEPISAHGPFVMNTYSEVLQAFDDLKQGRLGAG